MSCSAVTLSLATLSGVAAVTLIAIAFGTDNWMEIKVNRTEILEKLRSNSDVSLWDNVQKKKIYFTRDTGLFRECFPEGKPEGLKTYLSPTESQCINIDYYIPEGDATISFEDHEFLWLHLGRASVALIICGFLFIGIAFITGVAGCWCRSSSRIIVTGVFMLVAGLFVAGGVGCWHGRTYQEWLINKDTYQRDEINIKSFYGWSYIVCWIGVGWCLISAILLFCAAKCLRDEKELEETKHLQYLMPVYPGKQPYGYGYGYPSPYYPPHAGSQYGPYSY